MTSVKLLRWVRNGTRFHTTWLMASVLTGIKSCWLFLLEYHARESVPDTHSEYRRVKTSASSGVCNGQSWTTDISLQLLNSGDAVSMHVTCARKLNGDILNNICIEFTLHEAIWSICLIVGLCNFSMHWFSVLCRMTADFVHIVYDMVSVCSIPHKVVNICYNCIMHKLFLKNMVLQKLLKYLNRWGRYVKN